jgi:hypothetical protein
LETRYRIDYPISPPYGSINQGWEHINDAWRARTDNLNLAPLSFARNPNVVDQACLSDEDGQYDERFTFDPLQGSKVA